MSRTKLRIHNTDLDNLTSNLRGEIGEIIFTWILMRDIKVKGDRLRTDDPAHDLTNHDLAILNILVDKLRNEIVARLSELAERKIGRLTFYFAQEKLRQFEDEVNRFSKFVQSNRLEEKRNYDISHKELPEKWSEHKLIHIPYKVILRGIATALRLMKKIDRVVLGPSSKFLWREMRKVRYTPLPPAKVSYMLLPYMRLSAEDRLKIVQAEEAEARGIWEGMQTLIDGVEVTVKAWKKWGVVVIHDHLLVLPEYPLIELNSIESGQQP